MKLKIAILGSTGSIGRSLVNIIKKKKVKYNVILLSCNENYKTLINQAKLLKAKNLIITNKKSYRKALKILNKNSSIRVFNNFENFKKIFSKKIDYLMSSIIGISGLSPTLDSIKYTKKIAIANKESLICAWRLIEQELKKNDTEFIPVDSEHFSTWFGLKGHIIKDIEKIYLTASGGPFLKLPLVKFKNIKLSQALKHPNWNMGKKISVDSALMANKLLEIIEARNIFNLDLKKISVFIHPDSYLHAILKFKNGLTKFIFHKTDMSVPIENSLKSNDNTILIKENLNLKKINNLKLSKVSSARYPMMKLLKHIPNHHSLYDSVIISANEITVNAFIDNLISFNDIYRLMFKIVSKKEFHRLKHIEPSSINDIKKINSRVCQIFLNYLN